MLTAQLYVSIEYLGPRRPAVFAIPSHRIRNWYGWVREMISEHIAENTRVNCPSGINCNKLRARVQKARVNFGWCARAREVRVYSAVDTYAQKRLAPSSDDCRARSTLAHASVCLARTPVLRSPDVGRPRGEHAVAWPGLTSSLG